MVKKEKQDDIPDAGFLDHDFLVQKTLGDDEPEIGFGQAKPQDALLEMPMDLDCFKEESFAEPPFVEESNQKKSNSDPSATFGLMPLGSAIDIEEAPKNIAPIKEIDLQKAGLDKFFISEPTAQTQEWSFQNDSPFDIQKNAKESHEMDSGFFNSLKDDQEAFALPFAQTVKPGIPDSLPIVQNQDQTVDVAQAKRMIPFAFGADDPTAIDHNDFISKKASLRDIRPLQEFPKEMDLPATSNLSGIPEIQNFQNIEDLPAKESLKLDKQKSQSGKRPKIQKRSRLAQERERASGKRRVVAPKNDLTIIWLFSLLGFILLLILLVLYFMKTSPSNTAVPVKKAEIIKTSEDPVAVAAQDDSKKKTEKPPGVDLGSVYEEAVKLYRAEQYKEAIAKLDQILNQDENYLEAKFYRADCYLQNDSVELALKDISDAISKKTAPTASYYYIRARCLEKQKNYAKAKEDYSQALQIMPLHIESLRGQIRIAKALREYTNALKYAQIALKNNDTYAQSEIMSLRTEIVNQFESSSISKKDLVDVIQAALSVDPQYPRYHFIMAILVWETSPNAAAQHSIIFLKYLLENKIQDLAGQTTAEEILQYALYKAEKSEELEAFAKKRLQGQQINIPLANFVSMAYVSYKQNNSRKAKILFALFNKIVLSQKKLQRPGEKERILFGPWLYKMSKEIQELIGLKKESIPDDKYIQKVIDLDLEIWEASKEVPFQPGDRIVTVNEKKVYCYEDILIHLKDIKKIGIKRKDNWIELQNDQFNPNIFLSNSFQWGYLINLK